IFNILGQRVATLVDKEQLAGLYSVKWNGKDNSGRSVASGIYLYQLKAEEFVKVRKLTMLR
ncbi:MAG: FlgD immunoglobulin-like domain containing protein, partial [bacterium]